MWNLDNYSNYHHHQPYDLFLHTTHTYHFHLESQNLDHILDMSLHEIFILGCKYGNFGFHLVVLNCLSNLCTNHFCRTQNLLGTFGISCQTPKLLQFSSLHINQQCSTNYSDISYTYYLMLVHYHKDIKNIFHSNLHESFEDKWRLINHYKFHQLKCLNHMIYTNSHKTINPNILDKCYSTQYDY